jgi:hypothetical protein
MHACLLHVYARTLLYLFIYLMLITMGIGRDLTHVHLCPNKDQSPLCLRHPFGYVTFSFFKLPNGVHLLADSFL